MHSEHPILPALQIVLLALPMPGLVGAEAIAGNVHAFSLGTCSSDQCPRSVWSCYLLVRLVTHFLTREGPARRLDRLRKPRAVDGPYLRFGDANPGPDSSCGSQRPAALIREPFQQSDAIFAVTCSVFNAYARLSGTGMAKGTTQASSVAGFQSPCRLLLLISTQLDEWRRGVSAPWPEQPTHPTSLQPTP